MCPVGIDRFRYQNEIIKFADMGRGVVVRELNKLVASELVLKTNIGNQIHYQANAANVVFGDIKRLVGKTIGQEQTIRSIVESNANLIDGAFIYGDFVKNNGGDLVSLLVISDYHNTGELLQRIREAEALAAVSLDITVMIKREYTKSIVRKPKFVTEVMEQPRVWLMSRTGD